MYRDDIERRRNRGDIARTMCDIKICTAQNMYSNHKHTYTKGGYIHIDSTEEAHTSAGGKEDTELRT